MRQDGRDGLRGRDALSRCERDEIAGYGPPLDAAVAAGRSFAPQFRLVARLADPRVVRSALIRSIRAIRIPSAPALGHLPSPHSRLATLPQSQVAKGPAVRVIAAPTKRPRRTVLARAVLRAPSAFAVAASFASARWRDGAMARSQGPRLSSCRDDRSARCGFARRARSRPTSFRNRALPSAHPVFVASRISAIVASSSSVSKNER